jgi:hypothetical protein
MDEPNVEKPSGIHGAPVRPRSRSGLAVFVVFFVVLAFCAGLVVWLVTRPFRQARESSIQRAAVEAPAGPEPADAGAALLSIGKPGTGPGEFEDVRALAVGPDGRLYAADFNRTGRIQVFDGSGVHQEDWHVDAAAAIVALAVTRDAQLLVVQSGEIAKYDTATGRRVGKVAYRPGVYDVDALPDGGFVAGGVFDGQELIVHFDGAGRVVRKVPTRPSGEAEGPPSEGHLAVDAAGRAWWLTGPVSPVILGVAPDGSPAGRIASGRPREQQFTASADIATDGNGRLIVTGRDGVQLWSEDGRFLHSVAVEGAPRGLAVVDPATIWVSTSAQRLTKLRLPASK